MDSNLRAAIVIVFLLSFTLLVEAPFAVADNGYTTTTRATKVLSASLNLVLGGFSNTNLDGPATLLSYGSGGPMATCAAFFLTNGTGGPEGFVFTKGQSVAVSIVSSSDIRFAVLDLNAYLNAISPPGGANLRDCGVANLANFATVIHGEAYSLPLHIANLTVYYFLMVAFSSVHVDFVLYNFVESVQPVGVVPQAPASSILVALATCGIIVLGASFLYAKRKRQLKVLNAESVDSGAKKTTSDKTFCIECGEDLLLGSKFCNKCGTEQP